jgi:hypothetical protein
MESATERVRREVAALWTEVFGAPAPENLDPSLMLEEIIQRLEPRDYARLKSASEARELIFPRRSRAASKDAPPPRVR